MHTEDRDQEGEGSIISPATNLELFNLEKRELRGGRMVVFKYLEVVF